MPDEPGNNISLEVRPSSLAGMPMRPNADRVILVCNRSVFPSDRMRAQRKLVAEQRVMLQPAPKTMAVPSFEFSCGSARRQGNPSSGCGLHPTTNAAEDAEMSTLEQKTEQP
jgi:hypothetical protein